MIYRDDAILRRLTSHLSGVQREKMLIRLLSDPERIKVRLRNLFKKARRSRHTRPYKKRTS